MSNLAEYISHSARESHDPVRKTWATALRATLSAIPPNERLGVLEDVQDLLQPYWQAKQKVPQRGGDVLKNVFELFKRDPDITRAAPDVQEELAKAGVNAEAQTVRNALNYLQGRSVLRRVGYGKYQLEDGRIIDGLP